MRCASAAAITPPTRWPRWRSPPDRLPARAHAARACARYRARAASRGISWRPGGVDAFDDSKGTNVGATVAALDGLGADKAPASWWSSSAATARDGFRAAGRPVRHHARRGLIGRDAERIEAAGGGDVLPRAAPRHAADAVRCASSQRACRRRGAARPACASLDMFPQLRPSRRGVRRRCALAPATAGDGA